MLDFFLVFVFGLCIGSFLNVVIYRLKTEESVLLTRSHCPHCGHELSFWDLIPLFSFLFLKGRCRYCKKKISWRYPLVEFTSGVLLLLVFLFFYPNLVSFFYYSFLVFSLLVIFVYDLRHFLIPDKVLLPAVFIVFLFHALQFLRGASEMEDLFTFLLSGLGASFFFFSFYFFSKGKAMGFGDVKLAFLLGLFLGWPLIVPALFLTFILGGIVAGFLLFFTEKGWKSKVPFGPFLAVGGVLSLFWGEFLIHLYLNLVLF